MIENVYMYEHKISMYRYVGTGTLAAGRKL